MVIMTYTYNPWTLSSDYKLKPLHWSFQIVNVIHDSIVLDFVEIYQ